MVFILILHLGTVFWRQTHALIGGDGIFTYVLSNNPYAFGFIDATYESIPQNNGWIDAHVLKECYVVENYDKFNYSSVYWHQRIDVHPLLYYFLVHTICSLFIGTYSNLYSMFINLFFVCAADILIIKLFKKLYGEVYYALVPFTFLFLTIVIQKLYVLPRMYMALAFFCLWYLYIHLDLLLNLKWKKTDLVKMVFCVFLGTQTHYYFYVYACSLTIFVVIYLLHMHRNYNLFCYIYSGIIGMTISWIFFPWVVWHIFLNQMSKHTEIVSWSFQKFKDYIVFLNKQLVNGRGHIAILIIVFLCFIAIVLRKDTQLPEKKSDAFRRMIFGSCIVYSLIIFTLDEAVWYYMTPLFLTFVVWFSMLLLGRCEKIFHKMKKGAFTIGTAVLCTILVLSVSGVIDYVIEYIEMCAIEDSIKEVAKEYQQYDCIFVERSRDNLFQGFWLEFGEYDEFKKIPVESFMQRGINKEDLEGRKDESGIIVYAPMGYVDEYDYQLLASKGDYGIYKVNDGAMR